MNDERDERPAPGDPPETGPSAAEPSAGGASRRPPLQFSLRGLFLLTAAVALLFGMLRWAGVPPEASAFILLSLIIAGAAAVGLMVAIMKE